MKAIVIEQFGASDVFKTIECEIQKVGNNDVLIKVEATSVNPLDIGIRSGKLAALAADFPAILHGDVAGVAVAIGKNVTHIQVGDEVYGWAGGMNLLPSGALAEYMLAPAEMLSQKPTSLTMSEAAALPLVSLTAYQGLIELTHVKPGQTVLIHGGIGGIAHIALQIAKIKRAKTYVTCSSEHKMGLALEIGADFAINYKQHDVNDYVMRYTNDKGFDIVFDTVGGDNFDRSLQAATLGGHIITTLVMEAHDLSPLMFKGLSVHSTNLVWPILSHMKPLPFYHWLNTIAGWVDDEQLKPLIDSEQFTFNQIGEAHDYFESGKNTGKVVLIQSLS
jgi:NADPH:quinone reductase